MRDDARGGFALTACRNGWEAESRLGDSAAGWVGRSRAIAAQNARKVVSWHEFGTWRTLIASATSAILAARQGHARFQNRVGRRSACVLACVSASPSRGIRDVPSGSLRVAVVWWAALWSFDVVAGRLPSSPRDISVPRIKMLCRTRVHTCALRGATQIQQLAAGSSLQSRRATRANRDTNDRHR